MLSSPASGNYLFHGGIVTSVYLGQTNRGRTVTSPHFCLCLRRHFGLSGCHIQGPRAELCLLLEHTLRMQPDGRVPAHLADPHPTNPCSPYKNPAFSVSGSRRKVCCWAPARHGSTAALLIIYFNRGGRRELGETSAKGISRPSASAVTTFRSSAPQGTWGPCP